MSTATHKHSLRVGDLVEIDFGPRAGCCGHIEWLSLGAYDPQTTAHIRLQTGEVVECQRDWLTKVL